MAKKRKKKSSRDVGAQAAPSMPPSERSADAGIREAENGYVVRVSSEGLGKKGQHYQSKTFVAMDHPTALRIASQGFAGLAKKVGKAKKTSKKASKKRV